MTGGRTRGRMRRALAGSIVAIGIVGFGTVAWLVGSRVSTWRDLYIWYNPAVGFQSAALPVGFEDLVERIKPTVVGVRAKVERDADEEDQPTGHGAPSSRSDLPKGNVGANQPHVVTTQGSGFFISSDGYAMTTNHLVARSENIEVTADDGTIYAAKLIGADPKTDLALLKIEGGKGFPAARVADKPPRIGEWVQSASPEIVEGLGLNKPVYGVLVAEVQPDSPAAKAGIKPGDIITSVAGQPASDDRQLIRRVSDLPPGKSIELGLNRQNE